MTEKNSSDNMQNRINNIFTGSDVPAPASLKEMEAMQNRIQELEANLKLQEQRADEAEKEASQNKKQMTNIASSSTPKVVDSTPGKQSWLTKLWNRLIDAHPSITNIRDRSAARLAASFLVVILLLLFAGGFARMPREGLAGAFSGTFLLAIIAASISYVLSRTKWIRAAIFIFALFFSSLAYFTIANEGVNTDVSTVVLVYVPLSLVVASAFLSSWAVFLLIGLNILSYYLTIQTYFTTPPENFGVQAGIITTIGMVLILLTNFRKRSEQQSLQEIKSANDELQLANEELLQSRGQLEQRVQDRTRDLELASEVGRTITAKVDNLYQLLSDAVEQIRSRFNLYYTQVYLTDRAGRTITLRAGTGEVGKQLLQRGHQLLISSDSLNGRAALEKHATIVADTSNSRAFLPNPLLPKTRSEMSVPLMISDQVIGVLDMQSDKANALNESNLPAFEALAGQLAVAIQNASLFEQANQARAEVVEQAKRMSLSSWDGFLNAVDRSEKIGYVYNQNEVLPYLNTAETSLELNTLNAPIQVAGAEIGKIQIADAANREWTSAEKELINNTAHQLSNHIENLRLLTQSEKYRLDAEQISKRLTRESWNEYFNLRKNASAGFVYNKNKVEPVSEKSNGNKELFETHPIYVRDEQIGELEIESAENIKEDASEVISAITQQLSNHIENLRLLEQAELSRVEVQKSQEQYELAVTGSNDGLWDWNITTNQVYFSPRWKEMVGYNENELTEGFADFEKLLHPDDHDRVLGTVNDYLMGKIDEYNTEFRFHHKQGHYVWILARGKAMRNADGTPYRMAGSHTDISGRKESEEAIRQAQEQYSLAVAGSNDGIWDWDITNDSIFYSARWKGMLGYEEHELTRGFVEWEELIHPEDRDYAVKALEDYLEGKSAEYDVELRLKHKDGHWVWIRDRGKAIRRPDGTPYRMAGAHTDITERKQFESRLSNALDIARLGNWEYNFEKDIFTFNDSFYSVFRTNIETVGSYEMSSAEYAQRFVHPDDAALVGEEIGLVIASKERDFNKYLEHRAIFPDGSVGHIAVNIHVERDENGKIIRWSGANQDITERKTAQEIIAARANQLETVATVSTTASTVLNPDALLQQVVNLTKSRFNLYHAHIYLLDENWNTLLLASGAGEVGTQMVESGHAIDMTTERSLVARAAREKQPVIINDVRSEVGFLPNPLLPETRAEMAIPMVVGDNVLGVFDVQSNQVDAFSKEDASIYSTLASQIAVALQNARLYQEQSATVTQLRELDRLKSSFLANMSHELRTPLNSILGFTEVMLEGLDGPLTPNMDNDLKLINKNGQHLLHLINDVLDMAKIESGKLNLIIEKFNIQEIFEEVINITSPLATEKKLTLKIDTKSNQDVEVNADRTRIRQVMINLVNNALKFTEKGKIIIRAIREENNVLISVKDSGIGIPPEHLEAVFSEFTQVDSSTTRKAGGTGLGLPISRRLIEMHGGKLWAESNGIEGEGSTFFVFMPLENRSAVSEPVTRRID